MSKTNTEMPGIDPASDCLCLSAHDLASYGCMCSASERALRQWGYRGRSDAMTPEQRDWCIAEIRSCGDATNQPDDFNDCDDRLLALSVLGAWADYAKDKGLM